MAMICTYNNFLIGPKTRKYLSFPCFGKDGKLSADGGKTWKEEALDAKFGAPYISRDGKFVTVNKWNDSTTGQEGYTTLLKYD